MYITPLDVAAYVYCPILQKERRFTKIEQPLSLIERNIKDTFMDGEKNACLKDSVVTSRKLLRSWERIWWPAATGAGILPKEAEEISVRALHKLSGYCKYDLADYTMPTVGTSVESNVHLGQSVLKVCADVVKINLESKRTKVIVTFGTRELDEISAALDPVIRATAYAFKDTHTDIVSHVYVNITDTYDDVRLTTSYFNQKEMESIRRMLYHVESGIRSKNYFANPYMCKECRICPNFKS